jgi:hypothetical protein
MIEKLLGVAMIVHGLAHMVGFVVPWRLATLDETPYKTTVFAGRLDVGPAGIRLVGLLWLVGGLMFALAGVGSLTSAAWWPALATIAASASLGLSVAGWPESRLGVPINAILLVVLGLVRRFDLLPVAAG